jgi:hypothetical protein
MQSLDRVRQWTITAPQTFAFRGLWKLRASSRAGVISRSSTAANRQAAAQRHITPYQKKTRNKKTPRGAHPGRRSRRENRPAYCSWFFHVCQGKKPMSETEARLVKMLAAVTHQFPVFPPTSARPSPRPQMPRPPPPAPASKPTARPASRPLDRQKLFCAPCFPPPANSPANCAPVLGKKQPVRPCGNSAVKSARKLDSPSLIGHSTADGRVPGQNDRPRRRVQKCRCSDCCCCSL